MWQKICSEGTKMAHTEKNKNQTYADSCYKSAKVVILGDSGVGKTALGFSLAGHPFTLTESTSARNIWVFSSEVIKPAPDKQEEQREILLWDLPGQPGYHLINQQHLHDVEVALVAFDSGFSEEADLLTSLGYWVRALQRAQSATAPPMKMFLVATRADVAVLRTDNERIRAIMRQLGFDDYFVTSAAKGLGVAELAAAIRAAIDWDAVPCARSSNVFRQIRDFVHLEISQDSAILPFDQLYKRFQATDVSADVPAVEFEIALRIIESQGMLQRFSFGNLVLLQPELLDRYIVALIETVRGEPEGLGSIEELRVTGGHFQPPNERLQDRGQEMLLLGALVKSLIQQKTAFRIESDRGTYLVFPSLVRRARHTMPQPEGRAVVFRFEGDVNAIYAILIVLLAYSERFKLLRLWVNAATFTAQERTYVPRALGGTLILPQARGACGILLDTLDEAHGSLTVFFDEAVSEEARQLFEERIQSHLRQRTLSTTLHEQRIIVCPHCGTLIPDQLVQSRRERGFNWLACPVCDTHISLQEKSSIEQTKKHANEYDVYFTYTHEDRAAVRAIAEQLEGNGIAVWFDEWEVLPGASWQRALSQQLERVRAVAVFIGNGIGPWQELETNSFLRQFLRRDIPVIPVILPNVSQEPQLPTFLGHIGSVDFRRKTPDPLAQLMWGITGVRSQMPGSETFEEVEEIGEIREIRLAIRDKKFRNYRLLATTIMRRMGITEYHMIDDPHFAFGTAWEVQLPRLGLQLSTQRALLLLRQTELDGSCYGELRAQASDDEFIFLMDIADVPYTPLQADNRTLWFSPDEVLSMIQTAPDQLPGWLARFILIKVERDIKLSSLSYQAKGAVKANIFVGRENELRNLSSPERPGGIIIGAHFSGKSSLLSALDRQFRHHGKTVVGPLSIGGDTVQSFLTRTLDALKIPIRPDMTPESWASALRMYHEQQQTRPILLLDEVDNILAEDEPTNFQLGNNMRSLQSEGHCTFYLAGHATLREYIGRQYCPFQNFAPEELLTDLSLRASMELVQRPMKEIGFTINGKQAHRIYKGTAGIPHLIQDFCLRLLCALPDDQIDKPDIATEALEEIENSPDYLHVVRHYYQYAQKADTKAVMLIIALLGTASRQQIIAEWQKRGRVLQQQHLAKNIRFLHDFGVIEIGRGNLYRIKADYLSQALLDEDPALLIDELLTSVTATGGASNA
jgi:GTPase SAR1 family protein